MRKTFAYNGITIGILLGLLIGLSTKSGVLCVISMIGISIAAFALIRLFENAVDAGVNKVSDAISEKWNNRK